MCAPNPARLLVNPVYLFHPNEDGQTDYAKAIMDVLGTAAPNIPSRVSETDPGTAQSTGSSPPEPSVGCRNSYFDPRAGDLCADVGGTITHGDWTITASALSASRSDTGRAQLCSQITAVNTTQSDDLMTALNWSLETEPPGSTAPMSAATISATLNSTGYVKPGATAQGNVCFADVGHPGQVLLVYAGTPRAIWLTSR